MTTKGTGRGGRRKGAGRKAGSATKRTREIAEKAAATGDTPVEVMIDNMRYAVREANAAEIEYRAALDAAEPDHTEIDRLRIRVLGLRKIAQDCATDAAPYFSPRLAAIAHAGGVGLTLEEAIDELDAEDDEDADGETEKDFS